MTGRTTLLLVEDEPIIALAERRSLEREGYAVIHASTGEQAVDVAVDGGHSIDLILMDIDLGPGIDGTEAAQRILETHPIPLVFLSSHTEKAYTDLAEQITSYGYIVKNSGDTVLLASIRMAFRLYEANMSLRRSEEQFRLLAENAPDLIYRIELLPERRYSYVSPSALAITGYAPDDYYADPDLGMKLIHPLDKEHAWNLMESGTAFREPIVLRWCRKDGTVIWMEQNNAPVHDESGALVAIEGIARDITERKKLVESLRESNGRLEAFLNISKEVSAATEMEPLLQLIVDSAAEVTKLQSNAIYLKDSDDTIRLSATTPPIPDGFPEELRKAPLCDHPHIKKALETRHSVIVEDTSTVELTNAEREVVQMRNLKTILYLPVCHCEQTLGVLILASMGEPHLVPSEEVKLLQGFANQAGHVIHRVLTP